MSNKLSVLNCGTFIRRKSDEIKYQPSVGIIYSDGTVKRHKLDTSGDRFQKVQDVREENNFDMSELIEELKNLGEHGLNFRESVKHYLDTNKIDRETERLIWLCIENIEKD